MRRILCFASVAVAFCLISSSASNAADSHSLLGMLAPWEYPGATMNGAEMFDGETVDASGNRTTQSIVCRTVMVTDASVEKVVEYYRSKLQPPSSNSLGRSELSEHAGRSVVFSDDSAGRPFAIHTAMVNTEHTSTTLIISRGTDEAKTHIAWKHYKRIPTAE